MIPAMRARIVVRSALVAIAFSSIAIGQTRNNPAKEWERVAKPEETGFSSKRLDALRGYVATLATTALIVVQDGKVVFEYGDVSRQTMLSSVRKSLLSILYGKYVANGKINLDATLEELGMDDVGGLMPSEKRARVRDVIAARSGVFHKNSNPNGGDDVYLAPPRGTQEPGRYFLYNNWDFNVAGYIFEKQTGIDIFDAFQQDIAEPIGMQDFSRALQLKSTDDPTLSKYPAYRFTLTARDMARVGQLMLQQGQWSGRQVIPTEWIKQITTLVTPVDALNPRRGYADAMLWGYGYMWWVWDDHHTSGPLEHAFQASGNGGHYITVLPEMDLVIAHTAPAVEPGKSVRGVGSYEYNALLQQIIAAYCGRCE